MHGPLRSLRLCAPSRTLPAPDASERLRAPLLRAGAEQRPDGYAISFVTAFA